MIVLFYLATASEDIHLSFSLFAPPPPHPHQLSRSLKVTLPVCQSLAMTPAVSVIHHVSCVSARCRTSRAVGGLSGTLALYNMQIITCKLPIRVCDDISVSMQMRQAMEMCVLTTKDLQKLCRPVAEYSKNS